MTVFFQKSRRVLYTYILSVLQQRTDLFDKAVYLFLIFLSFVYGGIIAIKNFCYSMGIFKSKKYDRLFVLGVGNIEAGGAGKTPHCLYFANFLEKRGIKTAIISRGYRSWAEKQKKATIVTKKLSAGYVGDEAKMMQERTRALVIVGKNRKAGIEKAQANGCECVILDDSFQNRKIRKDFEVVLLDYKRPFFNNHLVPAGFLRERKGALKRADLIILTNAEGNSAVSAEIREIKKEAVFSSVKIEKYYALLKKEVNIAKKTKVAIFCAIAKPGNFKKAIAKEFEIVDELFLLDHEKIEKSKLNNFYKRAKKKGAQFLICTEKDKVKIEKYKFDRGGSPIYATIKVELSDEGFLEKIARDDKFLKNYNDR